MNINVSESVVLSESYDELRASSRDLSTTQAVTVVDSLRDVDILGKLASVITSIWSDKYGGNAEYHPLMTPMAGPITVKIETASSEEETRDFVVYIYYEV